MNKIAVLSQMGFKSATIMVAQKSAMLIVLGGVDLNV
jgi:hypothetical protein